MLFHVLPPWQARRETGDFILSMEPCLCIKSLVVNKTVAFYFAGGIIGEIISAPPLQVIPD